jgi:hypothetical protein
MVSNDGRLKILVASSKDSSIHRNLNFCTHPPWQQMGMRSQGFKTQVGMIDINVSRRK